MMDKRAGKFQETRKHLKGLMNRIKKEVPKEIIKHAEGEERNGKLYFTIKPNYELPDGFEWTGRGDSDTQAKLEGWKAFMKEWQDMKVYAHEILKIANELVSSDWGRAFRQDYVEPDPMNPSDRRKVERVRLEKNRNRNKWYYVYDGDELLGQVATYLDGTQYYKIGEDNKRYIGGYYQTDKDPEHAYAILSLLEEVS